MKTYTHALKLHEERLEDSSKREHQLVHAIDNKRLELLELKAKQKDEARVQDPLLRAQIEELRLKLQAYVPHAGRPMEPEPAPKGIVKLGKKTKDGAIVPAANQANAATSAAE